MECIDNEGCHVPVFKKVIDFFLWIIGQVLLSFFPPRAGVAKMPFKIQCEYTLYMYPEMLESIFEQATFVRWRIKQREMIVATN